jgi:single-stranded DNA-binding protein
VHGEDGKTTWHTILAFGERAEKLKDSLTKGQLVEVVGYLHVKEKPIRGGRVKRIEEIYSVVVKNR